MKRYTIVIVCALTALLLIYYHFRPLSSKVRIGPHVFTVEVAATETQKELGLGGRASMPEDHGMLFPYDHKEEYNYWMRGMQFPLDFIWIDGETVADITQNFPPPVATGGIPAIVKPNVPVDKVLELNAGIIARDHIATGDAVEFLDR